MSGFGVKTPLRREIVTNDFMFNSSLELFQFLESHFTADSFKIYVNICKRGTGLIISGCLKSRMISIFESGEWQIKCHLCNCINCFVGWFSDCVADNAMEVTEISDKILSPR